MGTRLAQVGHLLGSLRGANPEVGQRWGRNRAKVGCAGAGAKLGKVGQRLGMNLGTIWAGIGHTLPNTATTVCTWCAPAVLNLPQMWLASSAPLCWRIGIVLALSRYRPGIVCASSEPHSAVRDAWPIAGSEHHARADRPVRLVIVVNGTTCIHDIARSPGERAEPSLTTAAERHICCECDIELRIAGQMMPMPRRELPGGATAGHGS